MRRLAAREAATLRQQLDAFLVLLLAAVVLGYMVLQLLGIIE